MQIPPGSDGRLRCDRCGCVLEVTASELLAFSHGDWPRCCTMAMILEVDDVSVSPSDSTALERPAAKARKFSPS